MRRYQSFLAWICALFTVVLVSCGSPQAVTPTYTSEQLNMLDLSAGKISAMRDRMTTELADLLEKENWNYVDMFIHGPLGTIRQQAGKIDRNLLTKAEQKEAKEISQELFGHLESLDAAADAGDYRQAMSDYKDSLDDIDALLKLVPESEPTS
ncbi:photosystem II protein PsbQ [Oscillatoriales cyanobacterium LEGE 11467]|uniref:Photosystem II protein PsbQ n=1 Tax=Zarconia navalis LEGE 11467 TaxID=1828826 RepID=A0A928W2L7_9CYAN|nr:photosystem II protein PsbQ [Zarconia navalis]MBE9042110.1 photosystem II protein PsbQ [Zarconia navalis LEGE 11467]